MLFLATGELNRIMEYVRKLEKCRFSKINADGNNATTLKLGVEIIEMLNHRSVAEIQRGWNKKPPKTENLDP